MDSLKIFKLSIIALCIAFIQSCTLEKVTIPTPTITGLQPSAAKANSIVSIMGENFISGRKDLYKISIGGVPIDTSYITEVNENKISFKVPVGIRSGKVTITSDLTPGQGTTSIETFTYYYTGLEVELYAGTPKFNNCTSPEQDCFNLPTGLDLDNDSNLIVADEGNNVIRKLTPSGKITYGHFKTYGCDPLIVNDSKYAFFWNPIDVDVDLSGDIYVTEEFNSVIRVLKKSGSAEVYAGKCQTSIINDGSCAVATIGSPHGISKSGENVYFTDNGTIRVAKGCNISTAKTNGSNEHFEGIEFNSVRTGQDMIYIADATAKNIKSLDLNGNVIVLTPPNSGLGGPNALTLDSQGNIFFTDGVNNKIYVLYKNGDLVTLAGSGKADYMNGNALNAQFNGPSGLALYESQNKKILFIADTKNQVIRTLTFQ